MGYCHFRILFVFTIFSCISSGYALPQQASNYQTQSGKLSKVTLLEIGKTPTTLLEKYFPAGDDGLVFTFLIKSKESDPGYFSTAWELNDFSINNTSYVRSSIESLKRLISRPQTVVTEVDDFLCSYRPDLKDQLVVPVGFKSTAMMMGIAGAKIPDDGKGEIKIRVGWNKQMESFTFQFKLAELVLAKSPLFKPVHLAILGQSEIKQDSLATPSGAAIFQGENYSFSIQAPVGWDLYVKNRMAEGLCAMVAPKDSLRQTRIFVVTTSKGKTNNVTMQDYIQSEIERQIKKKPDYKEFDPAEFEFLKLDKRNFYVKFLSDPYQGSNLVFVFVDQAPVFIEFVTECRNMAIFADDIVKFRECLLSYSFEETQ